MGIEVARSRKVINLSLRKYVLNLLEEMGLLGARPIEIPMDPNKKLLKDEGELCEDFGRYHRLIWKLNYLTITWQDILYAVSVVSQFLEAPWVSHREAVTRII